MDLAVDRDLRAVIAELKFNILMLLVENDDPFLARRIRLTHTSGDLLPAACEDAVHIGCRGRQIEALFIGRFDAIEAIRELVLDIGRRDVARPEAFLVHHRRDERNIVLDAFDVKAVERGGLRIQGGVAVLAVRDQLGDHRIIEHRDLVALANAGIHAHSALTKRAFARRVEAAQTADRWQEFAVRIFGVDAAFDGPSIDLEAALLNVELLAIGRAQHLLDEIDTGNHLGHRMLHLKAGIHFKKVEALVDAGCDELDCAGAVIIDGLGQRDGLLTHFLAGRFVKQRAWRFLDDFLVAALDRAFTLEQIDAVAMFVAHHLNFDMARVENEFLYKNPVVAKGGFGFGLDRRKALLDLLVIGRDTDTLTAAARRCLDHHRIADFIGNLDGVLSAFDQAHMARHGRNTGFRGQFLGADLVAHRLNGVRVRPDEGNAFLLQPLGEFGVLRKEAEARMHRLSAGLLHRIDDLVHDKIGFRCR